MLVAIRLAVAMAGPSLQWTAPPGCPTEEEVGALLEQEARSRGVENPEAIETAATVAALEGGGWSLSVVIRQPSGELRRDFELDSCAATAEAVAIVYALALSPEPEPEPLDETPEPDPQPIVEAPPDAPPRTEAPPPAAPKARPAPAETSTPESRPRPRARTRVGIHVGGGGGVGSLGRGGGHVLAGIGVMWPWIRFDLRADHAIVRRVRTSGVGVNLSATTGGLHLGVPVPLGPVELTPGVDMRAGALRARGIGGAAQRTRSVPWAVFGVGASLTWMGLPWLGIRGAAELEVPLLRHRFVFDALSVVRTQPVGGLFSAGIEFRFPKRY